MRAIHILKVEHTRYCLKAFLDLVVVVYLRQIMSQTISLVKMGSGGMKKGGGWEDDFCRLWEGCQ